MNGPKAPRNPEKKRNFFYIMREKEIFGARQPDGKEIQFLYLSDGRLQNSAQIVGGISDEEELELLRTTKGFSRLVHSIGVSVETKQQDDIVEFAFQMYGKKDIYGGGTVLRASIQGNGIETRISLADVKWTPDDSEPGQILFTLPRPEQKARVSIRLYLNDGYEAPKAAEEMEIDFLSASYSAMIKKSLMHKGDTYRLQKAIEKARAGEEVTLAYIGGSITQGAGATPIHTECYAYKSYTFFEKSFGTKNNVHFVKAGVGGTPSELGVVRFDRDVLREGNKPDIVVVEFAVNDEGDETKGDCFESLVRKILGLPYKPAVILLFSVFANDENLQERLGPIGFHYDLPMVSIRDAIVWQFGKTRDNGNVLSKNQFFYDMFHPNNIGHTIMADCLNNLFTIVDESEEIRTDNLDNTSRLLTQPPIIGNSFEQIKLLDRSSTNDKIQIRCGSFTEIDRILQSVEMDCSLEVTPQFPYNWMYDGTNSKCPWYELSIFCKAVIMVFKDSGEADAARAEVYVDGQWVRTADPYENGWLHCNPILIINEGESREHKVRIQIAAGDEKKKFTILGFGYVE